MGANMMQNEYLIDKQNNKAIFYILGTKRKRGGSFIIDADDFDIVSKSLWRILLNDFKKTETFVSSHDDTLIQTIASKYAYANDLKAPLILGRLKSKVNDFRKANLIIKSRLEDTPAKSLVYSQPKLENPSGYAHVSSWYENQGTIHCAQITAYAKCLINLRIKKTFKDTKHSYAKERAIYAAYLFEKQFYGDNFPEEEYARKEEACKVLDKAERAEVEDAIVEQLEKLCLARKKIDNYYQSQTLAAKLASGEVIVRPDWKMGDIEKSEDAAVKPAPEPEQVANDYTIKCSKQLLNLIHLNDSKDRYAHVFCSRTGEYPSWGVNMTLTNQQNVGTVKFSELRYADAKAMAVYAAYLFEKLVYGDNLPKTEYNRKLEVIKTLSAKDIEFVNTKVADKLEKVYTILKELASEKSAESDEPLSTYKIEKSTDELLEKVKQTSSKEENLETVDSLDELFAERFKRIEISERDKQMIQQAIAEMKQKPSLFQRIKDWFTN